MEENERALRTFILQAPIAIAILRSKDYVVEIVNEHALEFWGRTSEEVTGLPLFDCLPELSSQGFKEFFDGIYDSGVPISLTEHPIEFVRNGKREQIYFNLSYEVLYGADGKVNGLMTVGVDVTLQAKSRIKIEEAVAGRTKELGEANALLKQSNHELEQFVYIASHDLQEPLRKVRTYAEMLKKSIPDTNLDANNYVGQIVDSSKRMTQLIRDVLEFSELSAQNMNFATVQLNELINDVLGDFELLIKQKQATIIVDDLPSLSANYSQIRRLFRNLLSNAFKFAKEDVPPRIRISPQPFLDENQTDGQHCIITIEDNGIWI